jgi:hypothetical protein
VWSLGQTGEAKVRAKFLAYCSFVAAMAGLSPAHAGTSELSRYVGYTIIAEKTVDHWISEDGQKKGDSFEGCEFGRVIIFTDGTFLRCVSYSYHYSYRPDAIILARGSTFVMIVDDEAFDMTNR